MSRERSDSRPEDTLNLTECLNYAKKLALEAGAMQSAAKRDTMEITSKGGIDLVTAIDKGCEKHIFDRFWADSQYWFGFGAISRCITQ